MNYSKHANTKTTPQNEAIPGREDMVKNSAGGYVWAVDDFTRLNRFLVLGSEGGSYYQTERNLTVENAAAVMRCIKENGHAVLAQVLKVSEDGLAPKNDPAVFVLAMCSAFGDASTRALAFEVLPRVCRIGTHLFQFAESRQAFAGWGRGMRRAVKNWYLSKDANTLAHQLVKYQQRNGWSHRDLLRLSHPKPIDPMMQAAIQWAVQKPYKLEDTSDLIRAFELSKTANKKELIALIDAYALTREMIPTEYLSDPDVQMALLNRMPMTAMIRNLGNLSKSGLLKPLSDAESLVVSKLTEENLLKARVHPMTVLLALKTYASGKGFRGTGEWKTVPGVIDALDAAFYLAFKNVEPTGQKYLLGVDVSGSMSSPVNGSNITNREAACAMAMITHRTEPQTYVHGFSGRFIDLHASKHRRLDDMVKAVERLSFETTDCALPMKYALANKIEVDTFVIYTDNETWVGKIHPKQALDQYRQKMGRDAKLITCAFSSSGFTIADPNDKGMLDCVGLDASLPQVIRQFALGEI